MACSDCVSKFQITKLIDATLTDEDLEELAQAEDLAKRFLSWDLQEEDDGILDQLREMFVTVEEEVVLAPGEGAAGVTSLEHKAMSEAEAGQEQEDEDEVETSVPTEVVDWTDE
jgi:DNA mismatch repair protein MSH5